MKTFLSKVGFVLLWSLSLVAGFYITQTVMPLIRPPSLSDLPIPQKERYLISLSHAYAYNRSLPGAIALMNVAGVKQPEDMISDLLDQLAVADELGDAEQLSSLLVDLGGDVPASVGTAIALNLAAEPTTGDPPMDVPVEGTPEAQIMLATPTLSVALDYSLIIESSCAVAGEPMVEVSVRDQNGFGVPGHTFELLILDEVQTVHTGLRSERDSGYLNFLLREGLAITLNPISIDDESHPFEIVPCISETGEEGILNYTLTYVSLQEPS